MTAEIAHETIREVADIYNSIWEFEVPKDLRDTLEGYRTQIVRAWNLAANCDYAEADRLVARLCEDLTIIRQGLIEDYIEDTIARSERDLDAYLEGME